MSAPHLAGCHCPEWPGHPCERYATAEDLLCDDCRRTTMFDFSCVATLTEPYVYHKNVLTSMVDDLMNHGHTMPARWYYDEAWRLHRWNVWRL